MVRLVLVIVFVALFGCSGLTAPAYSSPSILSPPDKAVTATVVLLAKQRPYQWDGLICAAVWIAPHKILTAYHCIIPGAFDELDQKAAEIGVDPPLNPIDQEVRVVNHDNWINHERDDGSISSTYQIHGRVTAVDQVNDVALIATGDKDTAPIYVFVSDTKVRVGQSVFTVGHPVGLSYSFSRGYISNPIRTLAENERLYTQVNISVWHGNSGGGLFDEAGNLVGICSAMFPSNPSISFFVSLEPIRKLVASAG